MADLPPGDGPGLGFWMGLAGLVGSVATVIGALYDRLRAGREKNLRLQAEIDKQKQLTKDELDEKEAARKEKERTGTIGQWQEIARLKDVEIGRLNRALEAKDGQITSQQSALQCLYRQCSAQEVDITEQQASIAFYHLLCKRLASCLKDKNLPCEDVPDPHPRPSRRGDPEGADYVMRVTRQNLILTEAAQKIIHGKDEV